MQIERISLPAFRVVGKEGSTKEGPGFVARLWEDANSHFSEIEPIARKDAQGNLAGIWGLMTDFSRAFQPWENTFSRGLYLAGVECTDDAVAPQGWTIWTTPAATYLRAENEDELFVNMLLHIEEEGLTLAGAIYDYSDPKTGKSYMLFPISRD